MAGLRKCSSCLNVDIGIGEFPCNVCFCSSHWKPKENTGEETAAPEKKKLYNFTIVLFTASPISEEKSTYIKNIVDYGFDGNDMFYVEDTDGNRLMIPREQIHYIKIALVKDEKGED